MSMEHLSEGVANARRHGYAACKHERQHSAATERTCDTGEDCPCDRGNIGAGHAALCEVQVLPNDCDQLRSTNTILR